MLSLAVWIELLKEIVGAERERLSLCNKRYDIATTDAEKKAAVDDGLKMSDAANKLKDLVNGQITALLAKFDPKPAPVSPTPPVPAKP